MSRCVFSKISVLNPFQGGEGKVGKERWGRKGREGKVGKERWGRKGGGLDYVIVAFSLTIGGSRVWF